MSVRWGLFVNGGASIQSGGLVVTGGTTVNTGGLVVTQGGISSADGCPLLLVV